MSPLACGSMVLADLFVCGFFPRVARKKPHTTKMKNTASMADQRFWYTTAQHSTAEVFDLRGS
jgi:hypothetical protein